MRSFLLLSLAFLIGVAPVAIVPTSAKVTAESTGEAADREQSAERAKEDAATLAKETTSKPGTPESGKKPAPNPKPKAPRKTLLIKLTPNQHPGSGHSIDHADGDSSLLPDWPPALYARRLPMATVPSAPPAEPALSTELRAGHLTLPPPAA